MSLLQTIAIVVACGLAMLFCFIWYLVGFIRGIESLLDYTKFMTALEVRELYRKSRKPLILLGQKSFEGVLQGGESVGSIVGRSGTQNNSDREYALAFNNRRRKRRNKLSHNEQWDDGLIPIPAK